MRLAITVFVLTFAVFGLLLGFSQSFDMSPENPVGLAASRVESSIDRSVAAMQESSELPAVKATGFVGSIDISQKGIPQDADIDKREAAEQLLSEHPEFASIFFLTPDGDVYLGEPFEQQKQLPTLNYADRDWYKGASTTGDAYVSSVFMSAAIHVPAVAIAVPVHDDAEIAGYWVAIVHLDGIESSLDGLGGQSRVLLVDHNGTEVADTARTGELTELRSFANLQSVQSALRGESGELTETIDGVEMNARFAPVRADPNTWAIVFLEPAA
jgi:hypothetical protein